MEILKKFYDKIALGVLLLGLAIVMTLQTLSLNNARDKVSIDDQELKQVVTRKASLESANADVFDAVVKATPEKAWQKSTGEGALTQPNRYVVARDGSSYLLHYSTRKNPFTLTTDFGPEEAGAATTGTTTSTDVEIPDDVSGVDGDTDGIPDAIELALQMNPQDSQDSRYDNDGDGFSNYEEYRFGGDRGAGINNPKAHPPLAYLLRYLRRVTSYLPITFTNLTAVSKDDKTTWDISVKVRSPSGREPTRFSKIGAKIEGTDFRILDAVYNVTKVNKVTQPAHRLIIQRGEEEPVTLELKERVADESYFELLYLLGQRPTRLRVNEGEVFELKDLNGDTMSYKLQIVGTDRKRLEAHSVDGAVKVPVPKFNSQRDRTRILTRPAGLERTPSGGYPPGVQPSRIQP